MVKEMLIGNNGEVYQSSVESSFDSSTGTNEITDASPALLQTMEVTLLDAVVATGASAAINPSNFNKHTFQVIKAGTATVAIQSSLDNVNWTDLTADASGMVYHDNKYKYLRANVTSWSSGAVTCSYLGGN